jgi:hypothetical protein
MKKLKNFPVTNYHQFPQKYYFLSIVNNIIKIANLTKTKKIILDYGCGNRIFSKILQNKKIINYDINPLLSDVKNYENYKFNIVIFNHVLMYVKPKEIGKLFDKIKKINPKCEIIVSLSRQNILSKIAMLLTFSLKAHENTNSTYAEQVKEIVKKTTTKKKKLKIFGITDIFYLKFK